MVVDIGIGRSSVFTWRVRANLFYRGLQPHRLLAIGDTLSTTTEVVALRQNRQRPDWPPAGLAALGVRTTPQQRWSVLGFNRCAMLPLRDRQLQTDHEADRIAVGVETNLKAAARVPSTWDLSALCHAVPGLFASEREAGDRFEVQDAYLVSGAKPAVRSSACEASAANATMRQPRCSTGAS
jgi:hypothetical protein